jgi:hypothetical protein
MKQNKALQEALIRTRAITRQLNLDMKMSEVEIRRMDVKPHSSTLPMIV